MIICSPWRSKESENTDWVSGKLALPLLASAFAYVDLRELWDYRISITPMRLKPSWDLWSKKQEPRYVSHWFPSSPNSVWAGWKIHLIDNCSDAISQIQCQRKRAACNPIQTATAVSWLCLCNLSGSVAVTINIDIIAKPSNVFGKFSCNHEPSACFWHTPLVMESQTNLMT